MSTAAQSLQDRCFSHWALDKCQAAWGLSACSEQTEACLLGHIWKATFERAVSLRWGQEGIWGTLPDLLVDRRLLHWQWECWGASQRKITKPDLLYSWSNTWRNTCFLTMEKNTAKDRELFHRGFSWNIPQWGCLLLTAGEMRQDLKNGVILLLLGLLVSENRMLGALSYVGGRGQYLRTWDILDEGFFSYRISQLKKTRETFFCRLFVFFSFWR